MTVVTVSEGATDYHATVQHGEDGTVWTEVAELPGCFATAADVPALTRVLPEVIRLYLSP